MTRTLLAVSPHLDDAVFSAGGTLAMRAREGWRVVVATCFTGNVATPTGFALACQLDKGLPGDIDYMALRRAEDFAACRAIGAEFVHLPFLEAPHRGYGSAAALFAGQLPDDTIAAELVTALGALIKARQPDLILGPMAIGHHADHLVVRSALEAIGGRISLWQDWPYVDRAPARALVTTETIFLDAAAVASKILACQAYTTQLGFQFGSIEAMIGRLAQIDGERFLGLCAKKHAALSQTPLRAGALRTHP